MSDLSSNPAAQERQLFRVATGDRPTAKVVCQSPSHGRDGQREHLALGDAHRAVAAYEEYAATLVGCEETDCAGVLAGIHHSIRRDTQTGADYELIFVNGKLVDIEPAEPPRAILTVFLAILRTRTAAKS